MGKGAAYGQLLLHSLGKLLSQAVCLVGKFKALQKAPAVVFIVNPVGPADKLQMLAHGEKFVKGRRFGNISQQALRLQGLVFVSADSDSAFEAQQSGNAF